MNLFAIFSKTGKGVQEASGKTSHLSRADRNVLKEIDGKTSLASVSAKFDKIAADKFEALIQQLDKDGYIREVSSGVQEAPRPAARPAAPAAKTPPSKADDGDEALDFTQAVKIPAKAPAAPSGPKPPPMDLAAAARADADRKAKEDQSLDYRSRQEMQAKVKAEADNKAKAELEQRRAAAEAKARADAEAKARADAEAKARAEAEAKSRADADARTRAEAEAKVKAAREAAVRMASEARAKSDAAEQRARDAERRAAEAADLARKEVEEKAKRDADELRQRLEAEMKAKLDEERKAREAEDRKRREEEDRRRAEEDQKRAEEDRKRREEDERRRKEEAERRAKEDAERKAREEEDRKRREADERRRKEEEERRAKEDAERKALEETNRKIRAEEERKRADEDRKRREEEERRSKEEAERRAKEESERRAREESERRAKEEAERKAKQEAETKARAADTAPSLPAFDLPSTPSAPPPPPPAAPAASSALGDDLLADLDSFGKREEEEQKAKEEAERKAKAEAERKAKEAAERKAREDAERRAKEEAEKKKREEEEQRAQEEAERKAKEDEERAKQEEAERKRKAQESLAAKQAADKAARVAAARPTGKGDDDIPVSDEDLDTEDLKGDQKVAAERARKVAREQPAVVVATGRPRKWGKLVAVALFGLLVVGVGVLHVMPVSTGEYEKAASEALGTPVKIGSARLSIITGIEMKFENVSVGDAVKIRTVRGFPEAGSLFGARKAFSRVELEGLSISQSQLADAIQGKAAGSSFQVRRVVIKQAYLEGPLKLPPLEVDAAIAADGSVQSLKLSGGDKLIVTLTPKDNDIGFEISAGSLALPFVPALTLLEFGMKGTANRQGVTSSEFDGRAFDGVISGNARIRWGAAWNVDGEVKARGVKVAVFAPALVSEGKIEGRATYSMAGSDPGTLYENARMQGEFKIEKGVLGSFDLTRALQTGGTQTGGRTVFSELTGQGVYDKGVVQITNVAITAGAMNAGASLTIDAGGALSGRVVADVKAATQTLRATLNLSGKVQDPVIRK